MASSTTQKSLCATCSKAAGIFKCQGCAKDFCTQHATEHRQDLGTQMDEVILGHDQLYQSLSEQTTEPLCHYLMKQIDEWEQQSIEKIHQAANVARQQLWDVVEKCESEMRKTLEDLKRQLSRAREGDDFVERDLKEWRDKIDKLKNDLVAPQTIGIRQDHNPAQFISKIIIDQVQVLTEWFARSTANIRIEDRGQLVVHVGPEGHAAIRGSSEYSSGQHRFRFKIEQLSSDDWVFFGIISRNAPVQELSYSTPTTYGWGGLTQIFLNGKLMNGFHEYENDKTENDIIELFIDCDRETIRLTNERTHSMDELNINVILCPFPWQLSLNLFHEEDCVRILST